MFGGGDLGDHIIGSGTAIATALIGVAIIAVLVGTNSKTGNVITAAGNALAADIKAAVSPVTGGSFAGGGVSPITLN